jgi:hypothetical protein
VAGDHRLNAGNPFMKEITVFILQISDHISQEKADDADQNYQGTDQIQHGQADGDGW